MSECTDLLSFLKQQQEETRIKRIVREKGYDDSNNKDFGLNLWTNHLIVKHNDIKEEPHEQEIAPDHLVSFLSIPDCCQEDCLDTNTEDFQLWVSEYNWQNIPGLNHPSIQGRIQACSEGMILPQWIESSTKKGLEAFLLIRRDGICEFGMGRNAYYFFEKDTIFQFIYIIGRFWQFLLFINSLYEAYLKDRYSGTRIMVNMRGAKDTLLGDLAENWKQPYFHSIDSFRPMCNDNHLQIQRTIIASDLQSNVQEIIRWYATRIDNAWGQFEPRCYVSKKYDETSPFAFRKQK